MAARGFSLFGALFMLFALVAADTTFITPPQPGEAGDFTQNPTYELGDEIDINWKSTLRHVSIQVLRAYPPMLESEQPVAILGNAEKNKQPWTVDVTWPKDFDKTKPAVYYFSLYEEGNTNRHAKSHYFNVTTAEAASKNAANDAATNAGLELRDEKSKPAEDEPAVEAPGLSKKGKIGLAIVCIFGGGIVLGCYAFVTYWTMRHRKERVYYDDESEEEEVDGDEEAVVYYDEKEDKDEKEDRGDKEEMEEKDEKVRRRGSKPKADDDEIREIV